MPELADEPSAAPLVSSETRVYTFKDDPYSSHSAILAYAGQGRGRRVLDVGSADGFLAMRLAQQGWRVTGIERDPDLAACARRHCEDVIVWDLNQGSPPVTGPFDAIIYGDVLEHLIAPEAVFQQLNRLLADDGAVIVSVPNVAHLAVRLMLLTGRFDYMDRGILDRTHLRFFTLKTFRQFLDRCGVELTGLTSVPVPLPLIVPARYHGPWLRLLHRASAWGARCWPRGLAYQFVARGRRSA